MDTGHHARRLLLMMLMFLPFPLPVPANTATENLNTSSDRIAIISVADQKMRIKENGRIIREFPVSTSKFGLGDEFNSYRTPLGIFEVAQRIGHNVPVGGIFFRRHFTGKYYDVSDPRIERLSRDSILSRIIWLRGLEEKNRNAYLRGIYIHGTNQESLVGRPVSYGCIRMKNRDVVEAFDLLTEGTRVVIQTDHLPKVNPKRPPLPKREAPFIPDPEPAPHPVVPENARLVASASEPGAKPPTIIRSRASGRDNTNITDIPIAGTQTKPPLMAKAANSPKQNKIHNFTVQNASNQQTLHSLDTFDPQTSQVAGGIQIPANKKIATDSLTRSHEHQIQREQITE